MNVNEIFFAVSGLTSTSANHVANLAKEYVQNVESEINNVQFYKSEVALIGTSDKNLIEDGISDEALLLIPDKLYAISNAKSLIAWLREAIKARTALLNAVNSMDISEWAAEFNITLPVAPVRRKTLTKEDVLATMSIKERNRVYSLETQAAVIGKYIHPDGKFADERKEFAEKLRNKHSVKGEGRDTLLYTYTPTVSEETLENIYFQLQKEHRGIQAELNGILHEIEEKIREDEMAATSEHLEAQTSYNAEWTELNIRFQSYKEKEAKRIADLKIVIPNTLQSIYDTVNSLGK